MSVRIKSVNVNKSGSSAPSLHPMSAAVAFALLSLNPAFVGNAAAGPTGGAVTAGSATIQQSGTQTLINQSTPRAALNWTSFNIGAAQSVVFRQPSASSVALNRVVGATPSTIDGVLQANGHVFLVNPSGVLFGRGASVDVGGLVASTLAISNQDFMAGRYVFSGGAGSGSVVNEGNIRAANGGYVALIGNQVSNTGTIVANTGSVALGAGDTMLLDFGGDGLMSLKVNTAAAAARIDNGGLVQADGGRVIMNAQAKNALTSTALNVDGIVRARGLAERNGQIFLDGGRSGVTSVSGTLDASSNVAGQKGGELRVLGEYVGLFGNAKLDASGMAGGGSVLVGGDFQGKNADVPNAFRTYVGPDATIKADAITSGDGGKVIVWADDMAKFYGSISARGGANGGNGGFVEVSGKEHLTFRGKVDTTAPKGATGMLLLDPADIVIQSGAGDSPNDADASTTSFSGNPSAGAGTVLAGDAGPSTLFESELEGIAATTSISIAASNSITINDLGGDNNLNLAQTTGNSVSFTSGAGGFSMNTGDTITTAGGALNIVTAGGATIGGLDTNGGLITLDIGGTGSASGVIAGAGTALTKTGSGTFTLSGTNTYTGTTTINNGTLAVSGGAAIADAGAVTVNGGNFDLSAGTETVASVILSGGNIQNGTLTSTAGYDARSGSASANLAGGALTKSTGGIVTLSGTNTFAGPTTISAGILSVNGGGAIPDANAVVLDTAGATFAAVTSETIGSLSGVAGTSVAIGGVTLTTGGNNTSTTFAGVISGVGGALTKTGTGTLTLSGTNPYTGTTTINAGTLSVSGGAAIADANAVVLDTAGATLNVDASETIGSLAGVAGTAVTLGANTLTTGGNNASTGFAGQVTGAGSLIKQGTGTFTLSGNSNYSGGTTLDAGTMRAQTSATALGSGTLLLNGGILQLAADANTAFNNNTIVGGATTIQSDRLTAGAGVTHALGTLNIGGQTLTISSGSNVTSGIAGIAFGTTTVTGAPTLAPAAGVLLTLGAVDGAGQTLSVNGAGGIAFAGAIGAGAGLAGLSATAGSISLSNGNVTTTGAQTYSGPITLAAATTLTSSGNADINLAGTVNGAQTLLINTTGTTTLGGVVGGTTPLTTVTTDTGGTTLINSPITTTGAQTYNDAVTLVANLTTDGGAIQFAQSLTLNAASVTLDSDQTQNATGAGAVAFSNTVNGTTAGTTTLIVDARGTGTDAGGTVTFGTTVGAATRLARLAVGGAGSTFSGTNNVDTLAISLSGAGNGLTYGDADALTIGTVGPFSGIATNSGAVNLTAAGLLTVSNSVNTAGTGAATLTTTGGGNIVLDANIGNTAGTTTLISAGNIAGLGTVTGANVGLSAQTGVGSGTAGRISTAAGTNLAANTAASGGVFVDEAGSAILATVNGITNAAGAGGAYDVTATGTLTVNAGETVSGTGVTLAANGGASDLVLNGSVNAGAAVLTINAGGGISQGAGSVLSADTLTGSAGMSASLAQANAVSNLGAFTSNGFTLNDSAGGLNVTGTVSAATGAASITTTGGALALGSNNVGGAGVSLQGVGVTSTGGTVDGGTGDILANGGGGPISIAGALTTASNSATAVQVRNASTAALGNVTTGVTGTTTIGVGGDISGAVTQTGVISTGTLTGNTGSSVMLGAANTIANLGPFTTNGTFTLFDSAGGLTISGNIAAGSGAIKITAAGANSLLTNNARIATTFADAAVASVELNADQMNLAGAIERTIGVSDKVASVAFRPVSATRAISLGGLDAAGRLALEQAELNTAHATTLRIGRIDAATITIDADLVLSAFDNLHLITGSTISGITSSLGVSGLLLEASSVSVSNPSNQVITLAGRTSGAGAPFTYLGDGTGVVVGTISGLSGITTSNGNVNITTTGTLSLSERINAGTGIVALQGTTIGSNAPNGFVTAAALHTRSAGGTTLTSGSNNVGTFAGQTTNAGSAINYVDADAFSVGSVNDANGAATNGIATNGGNVALTANTGTLTLASPIAAGAGAISLTAAAGAITQNAGAGITADLLTGSAATTASLAQNNAIANLGGFTTNGNFTLNDTSGGLTLTGAVNTGTGAVSITTAGGPLALAANNVTAAGVTLTGTGVTQTGGSTVNAGGDAILIDGSDSAINLAGALTTTNVSATAVQIIDASTVALPSITTGAGGTVVLGGAGADNLSGAVTQNSGLVIATTNLTGNTGDSANLGNSNSLTNLAAFTTNSAFALNDGGGLNVTGPVTSNSGLAGITTSGTLAVTTGSVSGNGVALTTTAGGDITLNGAVNGNAGNVALVSAGLISQTASGLINATGALTGSAATTATLAQANTLSNLGPFTTNGDFTLNDANGGLGLTGAVSAGPGAVSITTSGGPLALASNNVSGIGGVTLQGAGVTSPGGVISTKAAADSGISSGAVQITAPTGAIDLAGTIDTSGADSSAGAAAAGGNVTLTTGSGPIAVATVNTAGGNGTAGAANGGNAGTIVFNVGGANPLTLRAALNSRGGDASGAGNAGSGRDLSIAVPTQLGGDVTVLTRRGSGSGAAIAGNVSFASTINADAGSNNRKLSVDAGAGSVTFSGSIGNTQALADLDVIAGPSTIVFNGGPAQSVNVSAQGGNTATFSAPVVLATNLSINTDGAADNNVTFAGAVNADASGNARTLAVTSGTGTTTFASTVGDTQPLGSLTVSGSQLVLGGDTRVTGGGAVNFVNVPNVDFSPGISIDTDIAGGASRAGDVVFSASSSVNSGGTGPNFFIDASADNGGVAGNVSVGNVGSANRLNVFSVTGDTVTFGGQINARQVLVTANRVVTPTGIIDVARSFGNDVSPSNAALLLRGLTTPGEFGTREAPIRINAPGLVVVIPDTPNTLPFVFLAGDPNNRPVYQFADDPSHRIVFYNGVAPDSPSSRAAQGAVVQQVRALLDELSVAGFAKENIRRQLLQGIILETGLSRPGIDEFVGEGVTPPTACEPDQKNSAPNSLAC